MERGRIVGRAGWELGGKDHDRGQRMTRPYGTPGTSEWKEQDGVWEENHDDRKAASDAPLWNTRDIQMDKARNQRGVFLCV
jgi:hypothetical protein